MKYNTVAYLTMGLLLWGFASIAVGSMLKSLPFIYTGCGLTTGGGVLFISYIIFVILKPMEKIWIGRKK